ncbi:hypothetical protein CCMSSC00406_0007093 [Pleurotus cornucopiae]|uniref:Uncharacterized protein n=1 Tax=Pleurotus cornucopiae TaxID=5321 RepID=A0ACB7J3V3_PLECO|nr:hypothetical protein CCMSSC00406_0007093 [Pleurotus cornucopiae]
MSKVRRRCRPPLGSSCIVSTDLPFVFHPGPSFSPSPPPILGVRRPPSLSSPSFLLSRSRARTLFLLLPVSQIERLARHRRPIALATASSCSVVNPTHIQISSCRAAATWCERKRKRKRDGPRDASMQLQRLRWHCGSVDEGVDIVVGVGRDGCGCGSGVDVSPSAVIVSRFVCASCRSLPSFPLSFPFSPSFSSPFPFSFLVLAPLLVPVPYRHPLTNQLPHPPSQTAAADTCNTVDSAHIGLELMALVDRGAWRMANRIVRVDGA